MKSQLTSFFNKNEQKKFHKDIEKHEYKNSFGFTLQDVDTSKLMLSFLKENPYYHRKYAQLTNSPAVKKVSFFLEYLSKQFGTNRKFFEQVRTFKIPATDLVNLLNPSVDLSEITNKKLLNMLPDLFAKGGVKEIFKAKKLARFGEKVDDCWTLLKPEERLLKIDLRKRKSDLMKEIQNYIEHELSIQKASKKTWRIDPPISYLLWDPQNSRQRSEACGQLKVWQMRKEHKSFSEIATTLKLEEDTAKKRFYKAYERIYGTPYDKDKFRDAILRCIEEKINITNDIDQKTRLIEKRLKFEEMGLREYLPDSIKDEADESGKFETDSEVQFLFRDIERGFCGDCINESCKSVFHEIIIKGEDPSRWDPCPDVIKFLQP